MPTISTVCSICGNEINTQYVGASYPLEKRYVPGCRRCPRQGGASSAAERAPASRSSSSRGGGDALLNLFALFLLVALVKYIYDSVTAWGTDHPVLAGLSGGGCCCVVVCAFALALFRKAARRNQAAGA